jgi:hypothetical protein
MPIPVKCSCGKSFSLKDELAGKAVKCPACQNVIKIPVPGKVVASASPTAGKPAAGQAAPKPPAAKGTPAAKGPSALPKAELEDLFAQEGFQVKTGKTCPNCFESAPKEAVLCVKCGFHFETGSKIEGHQTELDGEMSGAAALKKAARDMEQSKEMQEKLVGAGMPIWMLGLIFFILVSVTAVMVMVVNISRREEEQKVAFNAVATLLALIGGAITAVGAGAYLNVLYRAFKESTKQGLLSLIPPYLIYFGFSRFKVAGKPLLLALAALGAGIGMLVAANIQNR